MWKNVEGTFFFLSVSITQPLKKIHIYRSLKKVTITSLVKWLNLYISSVEPQATFSEAEETKEFISLNKQKQLAWNTISFHPYMEEQQKAGSHRAWLLLPSWTDTGSSDTQPAPKPPDSVIPGPGSTSLFMPQVIQSIMNRESKYLAALSNAQVCTSSV